MPPRLRATGDCTGEITFSDGATWIISLPPSGFFAEGRNWTAEQVASEIMGGGRPGAASPETLLRRTLEALDEKVAETVRALPTPILYCPKDEGDA